jgi:hypothetical protein
MIKVKSVLYLLLILFYTSCSILDSNSTSSKIVGRWDWILSTGGFAGEVSTPDSAGVPNLHLIFNPNYTFSFFHSDTLVKRGKYTLKEKEGKMVISYDTGKQSLFFDQSITFQGNDTLILADECYNCYINTYIRAQ